MTTQTVQPKQNSMHSVGYLLEHAVSSASAQAVPLATGYQPLDRMMGGLHPEELVVIGGRPGVGKTIVMFQWARALAQAGVHVLYASFEHGAEALLARLLMLELGTDPALTAGHLPDGVHEAQTCVHAGAGSSPNPSVNAAFERMRSYGDRLQILHCAPSADEFQHLSALVHAMPAPKVLFVDYLQKLAVRDGVSDELRARAAAEALKELAVAGQLPVVAAAAVAQDGLHSQRVRSRHILGAAAVAHEADVVMLLNNKLSVISRVHVAYDTTHLDDVARQVVLTVEKNRSGEAGFDLQFRKDFSHSRLDPDGSFVQENLVDDLLYRE
jgi:replicative DNA helicase